MSYANLTHHFCRMVNDGLTQGEDRSSMVLKDLQSGASKEDESLLLESMYQNFCAAMEPSSFFNAAIQIPDERFEQGYELLKLTFDIAELDSRSRFITMLEQARQKNYHAPMVLLGRFWRVLGPQIYDHAGQLHHFYYDPLTVSENIVGVISGNYMALLSNHSQKAPAGIGAIGNLAIREHFRGGKGHGTFLMNIFEKEMEAIAAFRGEDLQLIALEAQRESVGFWLKNGYRCVEGTRYAQPPLDFDSTTGERTHDEVPETLMVKIPGKPDALYVDTQLLADTVYAMYQNWSLARTISYSPAARKRAEDYVLGKVFAEFRASLPEEESRIRLTETIG
ncbi:MAG: GNAT family N-acetyltransferase [Ktedonobacteraceae bacterium]